MFEKKNNKMKAKPAAQMVGYHSTWWVDGGLPQQMQCSDYKWRTGQTKGLPNSI